jgi:hypothetical protein
MPRFTFVVAFGRAKPTSVILNANGYAGPTIGNRSNNLVRVGMAKGVRQRLSADEIKLLTYWCRQRDGTALHRDRKLDLMFIV